MAKLSIVEQLKKAHSARSIEQKDLSLKDFFSKDVQTVTLQITGFASKLVEKYKSDTNAGYHTMIYLKDGKKTGGFSGALYDIAKFFYEAAGLDLNSTFNKIELTGYIDVKVSIIDLGKGHTTYNFEILDGVVTGYSRMGKLGNAQPLLTEAGAKELEETTKEPEPVVEEVVETKKK